MLAPPAVADGVADGSVAGGVAVADALALGALALGALAVGVGVGVVADAAVVPWLRPSIRKKPRPTSTMTTTANSRRCWPGESSMASSRYCGRRRDRDQNGVAGGGG